MRVDAAISYDCPYTMKSYILIAKNALHVPSMNNNLIPPFILREAGIEISEIPKIHSKDPCVEDHSIYFKEVNLRIPLALWGIFSYFLTRLPSADELEEAELVMITPDGPEWNPHTDAYARNEENYLDWQGNIIQPEHCVRTLVDQDDTDAFISNVIVNETSLCKTEDSTIDSVMEGVSVMNITADHQEQSSIPFFEDEVGKQLCGISNSLDLPTFISNLNECLIYSKFGMSVGSMHAAIPGEIDDLFIEVDAAHAEPPKGVSAKELLKVWKIDHNTAKRTLKVMSQRRKHEGDSTLSRNVSTNDRMIRYRRLNSHFFTDTMFVTKKATSTRGNTCMQLFISDKSYLSIFPMKSKSEFVDSLKLFVKEVGAPEALIVDPSGEQTSAKTKQYCHLVGTTLRVLEEGTQWANRAELYIGILKESIRKDMKESNCPVVFWDYCAERRARIHNLTAKNLFQLQGQNPTSATLGDEGDISNLCTFDWFEWCYFRENKNTFPLPKEILGRVLGPAKNAGNEMSQWVLKSNGKVVPHRTLQKLRPEELHNNETESEKRRIFTEAIAEKFGDSMTLPPVPISPDKEAFIPYEDDETEPTQMPDSDPVDATGHTICEQPLSDRLIHAELTLPQGEKMMNAKVIGRHKDKNGNIIGSFNENPILNTIVYDVEFPDGAMKQYAANLIAENMYSQVDSEGHHYSLLDSIIDYGTDGNAVPLGKEYVITKRGRKRLRQTTAGWKLLVLWKGGSKQWIPLKDLKESNPVEVAEFAKSRGIDNQPAFKWWVPYVLKKRDRIIASVNSRVKKTTHKYGVEIPFTVQQAIAIDEKNKDTLWQDAIKKEMYNVLVVFEILGEGEKPPPGWSKSSDHIIFDVKMDFTRKARWVKDGHKTPDPDWSTYAGFVSRDSVQIALTYAALNDLDIFAADIKNVYLQAPLSEKHYVICGSEFGLENEGRIALIQRALYGGKSAGQDFWEHL
jgi:hypothetical protein